MQPTIGTPVYNQGQVGFISQILPPRAGVFTIGSGGLQASANDLEVIFEGRATTLCDTIVSVWIERACGMGLLPITPEEVASRRAAALATQAEARTQAQRRQEECAALDAAFRIEAESKLPSWAKAVIVAELVEDRSDSMTDYFGSATLKTVILGFSKHTRDLFPELRKAALNYPETADLHDAPESAEHRQKYSMGGGYFLKAGYRHSNGWRISKQRLYRGAQDIPRGVWALAPAAAPQAANDAPQAQAQPAGGFAIEAHTHTKGGFAMWVVTMANRVERAEFDRLNATAKASGGWYSRKWGTTPAGFAFKSESAAQAFAGMSTQTATPSSPAPAADRQPAAVARPDTGAKLRTLADGLQREIDGKFADRLANTPKRQREAGNARVDGYRLRRTQQALRALADHHDAGTVPAELRGVTTKAAVFELMRSKLEHSGGYYESVRDTGAPAVDSPASRALWAMVSGPSEAERRATDLREKIQRLQFASIPGYFPTPAAIVARMIEAADLPETGRILEPEAGSGAILDMVREAAPACELVAFERHCSLREILTAKGYQLAGSDFMESDTSAKVARVLMNPPFENGQDMAHVMRAFDHLEPGGRLVAIMSPGPFFRQDSRAQAFRAWFEAHGGEKTDLPAGSFKESGTGTASVMVEIRA